MYLLSLTEPLLVIPAVLATVLVITKDYRVRAATIESKLLLLRHHASRRFHVTDVQNMHDQIAFCAFHSFLVEVQMNAGYRHATHA